MSVCSHVLHRQLRGWNYAVTFLRVACFVLESFDVCIKKIKKTEIPGFHNKKLIIFIQAKIHRAPRRSRLFRASELLVTHTSVQTSGACVTLSKTNEGNQYVKTRQVLGPFISPTFLRYGES